MAVLISHLLVTDHAISQRFSVFFQSQVLSGVTIILYSNPLLGCHIAQTLFSFLIENKLLVSFNQRLPIQRGN